MAKPRSQVLDYVTYLVVRALEGLVQLTPLFVTLPVVRWLASLAYRVDRRHREVAIDNLRRAFPGQYTEEQLRQMVLDIYRHFAVMLVEMALMPLKAADPRWWDEQAAKMRPLAEPVLKPGRPILIVTCHYGNWELASFQLRAAGCPAHVVARPLDNPYFDARVREFRESCGHKILSKQGDLRKMYEILNSGGILCTLGDQDAGQKGMFVDFFGRPASTHRVMAALAQKTNALIVVVGNRKKRELLDHDMLVLDIIEPSEYAGDRNADRAITQRITRAIEDLVRGDPIQYLWLHRRWKHQPLPKEPSAKAA